MDFNIVQFSEKWDLCFNVIKNLINTTKFNNRSGFDILYET